MSPLNHEQRVLVTRARPPVAALPVTLPNDLRILPPPVCGVSFSTSPCPPMCGPCPRGSSVSPPCCGCSFPTTCWFHRCRCPLDGLAARDSHNEASCSRAFLIYIFLMCKNLTMHLPDPSDCHPLDPNWRPVHFNGVAPLLQTAAKVFGFRVASAYVAT